jgi:hypothetical protein
MVEQNADKFRADYPIKVFFADESSQGPAEAAP